MNEEQLNNQDNDFGLDENNAKFFNKLLTDKKAKALFDERKDWMLQHDVDLDNEKEVKEFEKTNRKAKKLLKKYRSRIRILERRFYG